MEAHKLLLSILLAVTVALMVLVWFHPSTGDFRADNPFWNGLEAFTNKFQVHLVDSFDELPPNPSGTALIVIPYKPFAEKDLGDLKDYILRGGTLIVLDDYAYGNEILSHLGLHLRFTGKPLLDPLFNYRNEWLPRITIFSDSASREGLKSIVLNHASTLNNTFEITVLAWSSRFSYLDLDGDSTYDPDEPKGSLPVAAYGKMGDGYVVVVSDSSILINSMTEIDDNMIFISTILNLGGSNTKIYVDRSHLPGTRLDETKEALNQVYSIVYSSWGTLGLVTVVVILTLFPIWRRKGGKNVE